MPEWTQLLSWSSGALDIHDPFDDRRPAEEEIYVNKYWKGAFTAHHDIYEACRCWSDNNQDAAHGLDARQGYANRSRAARIASIYN